MKDHPIIFSAPMILALLAGRKTMTRRLAWSERINQHKGYDFPPGHRKNTVVASPWQRVQPGDRLWVRETWRTGSFFDGRAPSDIDVAAPISFDADGLGNSRSGKTRVSIHMPRWASRLTLIVTGTKIERLQEISESDAIKEGIPRSGPENPLDVCRREFSELWRKLHGDGAWDENPEVVALSFTVHKQNIDALAEAA